MSLHYLNSVREGMAHANPSGSISADVHVPLLNQHPYDATDDVRNIHGTEVRCSQMRLYDEDGILCGSLLR